MQQFKFVVYLYSAKAMCLQCIWFCTSMYCMDKNFYIHPNAVQQWSRDWDHFAGCGHGPKKQFRCESSHINCYTMLHNTKHSATRECTVQSDALSQSSELVVGLAYYYNKHNVHCAMCTLHWLSVCSTTILVYCSTVVMWWLVWSNIRRRLIWI